MHPKRKNHSHELQGAFNTISQSTVALTRASFCTFRHRCRDHANHKGHCKLHCTPKDLKFSLTEYDLHVDGFKSVVFWVDTTWNDSWLLDFLKTYCVQLQSLDHHGRRL
jgi:hypothetical protein